MDGAKLARDACGARVAAGGGTVWWEGQPGGKGVGPRGVPRGSAHRVRLRRGIKAGEAVRWDDVIVDETMDVVATRRAMEQAFG